MLSRRLIIFSAISCILPLLIWQLLSLDSIRPRFPGQWSETICSAILPSKEQSRISTPQKRHRVAVASTFGFHHDVYMSLVWTLERVMGQNGGTVQVYAPVPFGYDFQTIIDTLRLYQGEVKHPDTLVADLNSNRGLGGIDTVVLGTCEVDLRGGPWREGLLSAWDAREAEHKFMLVCIVHNIEDMTWQDQIPEWSRRRAIRILPISEHVAAAFRRSFLVRADSADASIRSAGLEYIPVDAHIPVLDIPLAIDGQRSRVLSDAVIQGSFSADRRDYLEIFAELHESFSRDPKAWGYLPLAAEDGSYVVDTSLPDPPFRLFLIGSGYLAIPHELENVVVVRVGLNYTGYYELMSQMDICVPAFSDNSYYGVQASSTFAMAVECNVPILVTERIKMAYTYANDDRAVVTRPAAMREVEALRALRTGDASHFYDRYKILPDSPVRQSAEEMMHRGWTRSKDDSQSFKEGIWKANDQVVERLLRDS